MFTASQSLVPSRLLIAIYTGFGQVSLPSSNTGTLGTITASSVIIAKSDMTFEIQIAVRT